MVELMFQRFLMTALISCLLITQVQTRVLQQSIDSNSIRDLLRRMSNEASDVIFLLDRSEQISMDNFYKYSKKILLRTLKYHTNIAPNKSAVAVMMFHNNSISVVVDGISHRNVTKCELLQKVKEDVVYVINETRGAKDMFQDALKQGGNIFNKSSIRSQVQRTLVLFSDGNKALTTDEITEIRNLNNSNINLYVVGLEMTQRKPKTDTSLAGYAEVCMSAEGWVSEVNRTSNLQGQARSWSRYAEEQETDTISCHGNHSALYCDNTSGESNCLCDPGFYKSHNTTNCTECEQDMYKAQFGNQECERCPANTETLSTGETNRSSCVCPPSQNQTLCADKCEGRKCPTNAVCVEGECTCKLGWNGTSCENNIDDCMTHNCHQGACVDLEDGYMCLCVWERDGPFCESNYDECGPDACYNNAICRDQNNTYLCQCPGGTCHHLCVHSGYDCTTTTDQDTNFETTVATDLENLLRNLTWREWIMYVGLPVAGIVIIAVIILVGTIHCINKNRKKKKCQAQTKLEVNKTHKPLSPIRKAPKTPPKNGKTPIMKTQAENVYTKKILKDGIDRDYDDDYQKIDGRTFYPSSSQSATSTGFSTVSSNLSEPPVPVQPPALLRTSMMPERHDEDYQNVPVDCGMKNWRNYIDEIVHEDRVTKVSLVRLGHTMYASSGREFIFSENEISGILEIMSTKATKIPFEIKGLVYEIIQNSENIMVGTGCYALGSDMVDELICVATSRQYVVIATADKQNDHGQCKEEVQYIQGHLVQHST